MDHEAEHRHERSGAVGAPTGPGRHRAPMPGTARRRPRRLTVGLAAVGLTAGLAGVPALALNSNPPTGPGNVEIFPIRDMVAVEGYLDQIGQEARFTVTRGGQTIGRASGVIGAGGFYEINHPGGSCWDGVTPDIQAGDVVRVDFADGNFDAATTLSPEITSMSVAGANEVVVRGTYGSDADFPGDQGDLTTDPGQMVVEIVNPDMRDTPIGERAIAWPFDPADPPATYQVALTGSTAPSGATRGTFEVTFTFVDQAQRDVAAEGSATAVSWQAGSPDPDVEAQMGVTLSEFGEVGGPGFGGCPLGPQELPPSPPTTVDARGTGPGTITANFGPGGTVTQSPDITGYRVRAVEAVDAAGDGLDEVGKRLDAPGSATLSGLAPGELYNVEITAVSSAGESKPAVMQARASAHTPATADAVTQVQPNTAGVYEQILTGADGVTFTTTAATPKVQVHYTLDGSEPTLSSPAWTANSAPIGLRQTTTVRWLPVDDGNNPGTRGSKTFTIEAIGAPAAPQDVQAVAGDRSATVSWAADTSATPPTTYDVKVYEVSDGGSTTLVQTVEDVPAPAAPTAGDRVSADVTGLTAGTTYAFGVVAHNASGTSSESALSAPLTVSQDDRADAGADQTVRRGATVTLDGSASVGDGAYSWRIVTDGEDPLNVGQLQPGSDGRSATFVFPNLAYPQRTEDHAVDVELTITKDGAPTLTDTVTVTAQPDVIALSTNRYQPGNELRLAGTGTVPGARLTISDEPGSAPLAAPVTVSSTGSWSLRVRRLNIQNNDYYIHSDKGYFARHVANS